MSRKDSRPARRLHPLALRIMHWINAISILALIFSGWKIYDDYPILSWLRFDDAYTLGGHPETALQWHFLFMWPLAISGIAYILYGLVSGRFWNKLLPLSIGEILKTVGDALRFKLGHDDITHYNGVQKLLYLGAIALIVLQILTGLAIWKPVQFSEYAALFGSFQTARILHFTGMALICGFVVVHVALALLVPKTLLAMLTGGPRLEPAAAPAAAIAAPDVPVSSN
ncbi:MAG: cytochrome b/b6 domain-containing protein [Ancalomicrobiaceae bacterium]|nr:cytochrome b/b6 domain-containing protein [Ancalomicrobiaceae bacterium]